MSGNVVFASSGSARPLDNPERSIELPFPAKILWPNGRGHFMTKHKAAVRHKEWAYLATLEVDPPRPAERVRLAYTVHPKTRNPIDKDNAIAAMKAYQDGIALALKVDDSVFETPTLEFGEPIKNGKVIVRIEPCPSSVQEWRKG